MTKDPKVNCPHCGGAYEISVRETYIIADPRELFAQVRVFPPPPPAVSPIAGLMDTHVHAARWNPHVRGFIRADRYKLTRLTRGGAVSSRSTA
jgi:hypothetical protein